MKRDERIVRLAENVVNYSVGVQKGERIYVECFGASAQPLFEEVIAAVTRAGGVPFYYCNDNAFIRDFLRCADEAQIKAYAEMHRGLMEDCAGYVGIRGFDDIFADIVDIAFTAGMEEQLDEVEEGKLDWHKVLSDFYGPFEKTLENAESKIEKVEIKDEVSDVPCDKCGAMMVYKLGRYGRFLACPNFPECRNTKAIQIEIDAPCPKCGGKLLQKTSRKGRKFYGCERYPECDFVSWEMPVKEKCPKCGSYMTLSRTKKGDFYVCANENCRERIPAPQSEENE